MKTVLLFSGGMDSVAAWHLLGRPQRVYCRIGSPYEGRELVSLSLRGMLLDGNRIGDDQPVRVLDCGPWLGKLTDAHGRVPLRNLLFAVAAAAATGADQVVLVATAGETSPDKSRAFARLASRAMTAAEGRPVRLLVPFRHLTKRALAGRLLASLGRERGEMVLRDCPSCYAPSLPFAVAGCGCCTSCLRRWVAFSLNGIEETYMTSPWLQARQQVRKAGAAGLWPFLRRTPVRDWPGVATLNLELLRALRRRA